MYEIIKELETEFKSHVFPFWMNLMDREQGGYYGEVDFSLNLKKDAVKGCILNSRILWTFSNAYLTLGDEQYLPYAKQAYDFLRSAFLDKEYGGVYWSVTADGQPSDTTKHTYNQAFAIYGLSSYYAASKDEEALDIARQLMQVIETRCRDEGGYLEAFTRDFGPESNEKLSENGVMADRTMNTLLHVLEAYTELHRVAPTDATRDRLQEILLLFKNRLFNPEHSRLEVFFDSEYGSLIDLHCYGHDIEAAWLIDRAVEVLGAEGTVYDLSKLTEILTKKIYDTAFDGHSLPAECERGKVLETRVWWVECEAIIGFLNGWQKSGVEDVKKEEYLKAALAVWEYTKEYIIDRREGSCWYAEVAADGTPDPKKCIADAWTCPYHNGRMYFEVLKRLGTQ